VTSNSQIVQSLSQIATQVSQLAAQLQQIGLQLNALGQQVAQNQVAVEQAAVDQTANSTPQPELLERFASLEELVQKLSIRVNMLERREVAFTAPLQPAVELDEDTEDEPDEILWDFIEPAVPGLEARSS
jgi:chromosome segregation ATPase